MEMKRHNRLQRRASRSIRLVAGVGDDENPRATDEMIMCPMSISLVIKSCNLPPHESTQLTPDSCCFLVVAVFFLFFFAYRARPVEVFESMFCMTYHFATYNNEKMSSFDSLNQQSAVALPCKQWLPFHRCAGLPPNRRSSHVLSVPVHLSIHRHQHPQSKSVTRNFSQLCVEQQFI